jgi:hypothetical protein
MTVTLNADIALLDPADARVAVFLKLPVNSDALIELINEASAECEAYCNRPIRARDIEDAEFESQDDWSLRVAAWPIDVDSPISVIFDGIAQTVWRKPSDGNPDDFDVEVRGDIPGGPKTHFYRRGGWRGRTRFPTRASFTGGFDPIPGDIQRACKLACQLFARQEKGQTDVSGYGPGPVSQSITYGRPDSLLPVGAQRALDRIRVVPL